VLGFGWAKEVRAATGDHRYAMYRAPEQRGGNPIGPVNHTVDQFALGAIAYEMLAGCAYISEESSDLADPEASRSRQPPRVAEMVLGLPAAVDDVLRRALSYDPGKRFPSVAEFAGALTDVAEAHGTSPVSALHGPPNSLMDAPPIGIGKPALSARTRLVFLAIAAAIVIMAVGLMASSLNRNDPVAAGTLQTRAPKIEAPPPQVPAPASEATKLPLGSAQPQTQVIIPEATRQAVPSEIPKEVRTHQKRHLRTHSRRGTSRRNPDRRSAGAL
jgi:serine/threonine protein kinase